MSNLQSTISALTNEFAQNVARAVMKSFSELDPFVGAGAVAAPKAAPAPAPKAAPKAAAKAAPAPKAAPAAKAAPAPKAAPKAASAPADGPVLQVSRASAETKALLAGIVRVLKKGPLFSEDLRRELNITRRDLAKPIAEGLKTRQIVKKGDRRKTTYELP